MSPGPQQIRTYSRQRGAPVQPLREEHQEVTVTDPRHPLYGRTFQLSSGSAGTGSHCRALLVWFQEGVQLRLPADVTGARGEAVRVGGSKLSYESVKDLVDLLGQYEREQREGGRSGGLALQTRHDGSPSEAGVEESLRGTEEEDCRRSDKRRAGGGR